MAQKEIKRTTDYKLTIEIQGKEEVLTGAIAAYVWQQLQRDALIIPSEDGKSFQAIGGRYKDCICVAKLEVTTETEEIVRDTITICVTPDGTIITDVPAASSEQPAPKADSKKSESAGK